MGDHKGRDFWAAQDWSQTNVGVAKSAGCGLETARRWRERLGLAVPVSHAETRERFAAAWERHAGKAAAVAAELGTTQRNVYGLIGVREPKPRLADADREHVAALLRQGMSQRSVAAATRHARNTVAEVAASIGKGRAKPRRPKPKR